MIRIRMGPRRNRSIVGAVVAGLICTALSAFCFFILVTGARLSGGIPLVPDALNQGAGKVIVALCAVFTFWLAGYAFYDAWRLCRERSFRRQKSS